MEQVRFHGSAVESVVELGDISWQVFAFDRVVGFQQEALQVGQRDVHPGKELVRGFVLPGNLGGGMLEFPLAQVDTPLRQRG